MLTRNSPRQRPLARFGRDQRGLAAVEFALLAPIMILLYCGLGELTLAMMAEPSGVAPVLSQPSLPLPLGPGAARRRSGMGVSGEEVAGARRRFEAEGLSMIGLRFKGDPSVPDERFESYQQAFGDRFERWDIEPSEAAPVPSKSRSLFTPRVMQ